MNTSILQTLVLLSNYSLLLIVRLMRANKYIIDSEIKEFALTRLIKWRSITISRLRTTIGTWTHSNHSTSVWTIVSTQILLSDSVVKKLIKVEWTYLIESTSTHLCLNQVSRWWQRNCRNLCSLYIEIIEERIKVCIVTTLSKLVENELSCF